MAITYQAVNLKAPFDGTRVGQVANDFDVRKIDSDTTHKVTQLPDAWKDKMIAMKCSGGDVHFALTLNASAEVDRTVASSNAGASDKVGYPIADGLQNEYQVRVPNAAPGVPVFLVHEASVDNTILYARLASD